MPSSRLSPNPTSTHEQDDDDDREAMLAALNAHSRAMFGLAALDGVESNASGTETSSVSLGPASPDRVEEDREQSDDGWGADDGFVSDSEDGLDLAQGEPSPSLLKLIYRSFLIAGSTYYVRSRLCPVNIQPQYFNLQI